jgi:hypothetical protein
VPVLSSAHASGLHLPLAVSPPRTSHYQPVLDLSQRMNTAVTKFPRGVYAILLLRGLRAQAKPMDRPFAAREKSNAPLFADTSGRCLRPDLPKNRLLPFYFTVGCLT